MKNKMISALATLGLVSLLSFSNCSSYDDDATDPCDNLQCLNGGERKMYVDNCFCVCPMGFTGKNCEIESDCPPSAECPMGQFANPANDCKCQPI